MQFRQKLDQLEKRFEELTAQMADPAVIADSEQYRKVTKTQSELSELVAKYREWKRADDSLQQAQVCSSVPWGFHLPSDTRSSTPHAVHQHVVEQVLHRQHFPMVYGEDCSVLLGTAPSLAAAAGSAGLLFLDGH